MTVPHTIPRHVIEAYRCSPETQELQMEQNRTIRAEDETWDADLIPNLKVLALRVIVSTWKDNPLLEELPTCADRNLLLETLPTDLPFELVVTKIHDQHYWQRMARNRWEHNDPGEHGYSWRRLYCERHLWEYLEKLDATYFEGQKEECEKLLELTKDYIRELRLRSLLPTKPARRTELDDGEPFPEDEVHHIPLATILAHLPHLSEIHLNFAVIYMNAGFEWRDFEFSVADCVNLAEGLVGCRNLERFALTRSNLDQPRTAAILHGLENIDRLKELDFSFCNLADTGSYAVGEFLSIHRTLETLHLVNNNIGPGGLAGFVCGFLKTKSPTLKHLNLRLNPLEDEGASHICALLLRNESLEVLDISGCGITEFGGSALAEVLSSGDIKLASFTLDISNNDLGEEVGRMLEGAVKSSPYIIGFDGRMCNFSKESEYAINRMALRYKNAHKKEMVRTLGGDPFSAYTIVSRKSLERRTNAEASADIDEGKPVRSADESESSVGEEGLDQSEDDSTQSGIEA